MEAGASLGYFRAVDSAQHSKATSGPTVFAIDFLVAVTVTRTVDSVTDAAGPFLHPDRHDERPVSRPTTHPSTVHGIDHVGVTVPDLDSATRFFVDAFGAEVLYDALPRAEGPRRGTATTTRLGIDGHDTEVAIRMLALPNGPGLELFEFSGPERSGPVTPADFGWQHLALYVDDVDAALEALETAGGQRLADPIPLSGNEAGDGNRFVYARTPWGSTVELLTYPSEQGYVVEARRRKWRV